MMKRILLLLLLLVAGTSVYAQNSVNEKGYFQKYSTASGAYHSEDGVLYLTHDTNFTNVFNRVETLVKYPQTNSTSTYTVIDGTYAIAKGAFQGNKFIQVIRIPSTVNFIGDNAFEGCDNLKSIEVYESSISIEEEKWD